MAPPLEPAAGGAKTATHDTEPTDSIIVGASNPEPVAVPAGDNKDSETSDGVENAAGSPETQAESYTRLVADWLTTLRTKAMERGTFLPEVMIEMCPLTGESRQKILELVPWLSSAGYTTMLRRDVPKSRARGALHISSINFGQKGFLYAGDSIVWLQQFDATSSLQRLGALGCGPGAGPWQRTCFGP